MNLKIDFSDPRGPHRAYSNWLLLADSLTFAAALLFASEAAPWRAGILPFVLLGTWGAAPHFLAHALRTRGWPRHERSSLALGVTIATLGFGLGWLGNTLIAEFDPQRNPVFVGTLLLILVTWSLAFVAFANPIYRLLDFLGGGIVLMAILERRPDAIVFVPIWLFALSWSTRLRRERAASALATQSDERTPIRGVVPSLVLATFAGAAFWSLFLYFYPRLDLPRLAAEGGETTNTFGQNDVVSDFAPFGADLTAADSEGTRIIGLSPTMRLSDIRGARRDKRLALRIQKLDGDQKVIPADADDLSQSRMLLRMASYFEFFPSKGVWEDDRDAVRSQTWKTEGLHFVRQAMPDAAVETWRVVIEGSFVKTLLLPYGVTEFSAPSEARPGAVFLDYESGEIKPNIRDIPTGSHYDILFQPSIDFRKLYSKVRVVRLKDNIESLNPWLAISPRKEWNEEIRQIADRVMGMHYRPEDKLRALANWYDENFDYSIDLDWLDREDRSQNVLRFLNDARRGDCPYFATSAALLLRAQGIPTRVVQGYAGLEFDKARGEYRIHNYRAHAWVEVRSKNGEWLPFDTTVDSTGSIQTPSGLSTAGSAPLGRGLRLFPDLILLAGALAIFLLSRILNGTRTATGVDEPTLALPARELPDWRDLPGPDDRRQILAEYHSLQLSLQPGRRHRHDSETAREHGERWHREDDPRLQDAFRTVESTLASAIYGRQSVDEATLKSFRKACRTILRRL